MEIRALQVRPIWRAEVYLCLDRNLLWVTLPPRENKFFLCCFQRTLQSSYYYILRRKHRENYHIFLPARRRTPFACMPQAGQADTPSRFSSPLINTAYCSNNPVSTIPYQGLPRLLTTFILWSFTPVVSSFLVYYHNIGR